MMTVTQTKVSAIVDLMLRRDQIRELRAKIALPTELYYGKRLGWRADEVLCAELLRIESEIEHSLTKE